MESKLTFPVALLSLRTILLITLDALEQIVSSIQNPSFNHTSQSLSPCEVTHSQVLGIRLCISMGGGIIQPNLPGYLFHLAW